MFILLINCIVISESQRKGTAVLGGGQTFRGLLPEVVATGGGYLRQSADEATESCRNAV
jgi:hypothetical protein